MAKTASNMLPLGTQAPDFHLMDVQSNQPLSLKDCAGEKATVVMFICNHCPYVKHINRKLADLAQTYHGKEVKFVAINANDVENYPDDSPEKMKHTAEICGYPFPYLFDETQEVAKAYQAACTPDFYVFDEHLQLVYRGQFDDSRPGNDVPVSGDSLNQAITSLLADEPLNSEQRASLGCGIKWKQ